jgi:UDP-2,4-diacetamido-2,4,6-trideoxy-beta-L-altropyranose hydrolase
MSIISFRVDASSRIGYGHVVRCAALAQSLAARGAQIHFVCRELPGHYCDALEGLGFHVHRLPGQDASLADDIAQSQAALAATGVADWLVVDHYKLDARWEQAMRTAAKRIFVIDDLADRNHDCDLLLDQNFSTASAKRYAGLVAPGTHLLLGPAHALLRPEFAQRRSQRPLRDGAVRRVLVCFGGADPQQHTIATLDALRPHASRLDRIDVVIGLANPHRAATIAACATLPNATLHCPAQDISELLAASDLAIGAGGSMNWERACLGVPTLAFGIADNQHQGMAALVEGGYIAGIAEMHSPDEARIAAWLSCLLDNPALLRGLSARSATLVDGRGAERLADALLATLLTFRLATAGDSDNLLRWRNDPAIRGVSLDSGKIDQASHEGWLQRTLADPQRILLVAEFEGKPAGVVRFDLVTPEALVSVYRVPQTDAPGGLIRQATDWLRTQHPEIRKIRAEILPHNTTSLLAFRNAGYRDVRNTLLIELDMP